MALVGEIAVEPIATRAGCIDQDQVWAVGWPPPAEGSAGTRSCPAVAAGDDLSAGVLHAIGDGHRVCRDIQPDVTRASVTPG
jgi:hypothetical protein